jgi:hypothetical protein
MNQLWSQTLDVAAKALTIRNLGPMLNERYLHHFLSRHLHGDGDLLPLTGDHGAVVLHPEWPTRKKKPDMPFGRYRFTSGKYLPDENGSAGFIDFALGRYEAPDVAVEMSLKGGWDGEEIVYDFVKLLDGRNPFKYALSLNFLLRPKGVSKGGRKDWLHRCMMDAYEEALTRLQESPCPPDRKYILLISEIAETDRRHWYWDEAKQDFVDTTAIPPVLALVSNLGDMR